MSRPDGKADSLLGKTVLDEPKTKQSDPNVLDLQLRAIAKQPIIKPVVSYMLHCFMYDYKVNILCKHFKTANTLSSIRVFKLLTQLTQTSQLLLALCSYVLMNVQYVLPTSNNKRLLLSALYLILTYVTHIQIVTLLGMELLML